VSLTRMLVRALLVPPGIPDFLTRTRFLSPGRYLLEGRAWSGYGDIQSVDVSTDGGRAWGRAQVGDADSPFAWRPWWYEWMAEPGDHELCCRATDNAGNTQPIGQNWNYRGVANNMIQRVRVVVS